MTQDDDGTVYAVRLHPQTRSDIESARQYLEGLTDERHAAEWETGLFDALGTLATSPRRHSIARESRLFQREVRQMIYRRTLSSTAYRVLFTVYEATEEAPFVFVLHIRHAARKPMTRKEARQREDD